MTKDPINILLVDDQPAKLLSYEATLQSLGENLIKAGSAREALEHLLKEDIAIILSDVCMPELDGFELARMIRNHPRFQHTAIIFVSAVALTDPDRVKGGGRLRASAGRPRSTSGQGAGIFRSLPEDPGARAPQCGAGAPRRREDRRADACKCRTGTARRSRRIQLPGQACQHGIAFDDSTAMASPLDRLHDQGSD